MKLAVLFIKWIFVKMGKGLLEQHQDFKKSLRRDTGITLFLWLVVSLISSIVVFLLLVGIQYLTGLDIPIQVWLSYIYGCVAYLLYTAFSVMYNTFKAERQELFTTIKNGR